MMIYKILGGLEYIEANRPCYWTNETPLLCKDYQPGNPPKDMKALPLEDFPLIEDFEIVLESAIDETGNSMFGYQVSFFSLTLGYIASFPWWDNVNHDLARKEFWVLGERSGVDLRYNHPDFSPARPVSIPLGIYVADVDSKEELEQVKDLPIDGIITNRIEIIGPILKE